MIGISDYLHQVAHPPATTLAKFEFLVAHLNHTHKLTAMVNNFPFPFRKFIQNNLMLTIVLVLDMFGPGLFRYPALPHRRSDYEAIPQGQEGLQMAFVRA